MSEVSTLRHISITERKWWHHFLYFLTPIINCFCYTQVMRHVTSIIFPFFCWKFQWNSNYLYRKLLNFGVIKKLRLTTLWLILPLALQCNYGQWFLSYSYLVLQRSKTFECNSSLWWYWYRFFRFCHVKNARILFNVGRNDSTFITHNAKILWSSW